MGNMWLKIIRSLVAFGLLVRIQLPPKRWFFAVKTIDQIVGLHIANQFHAHGQKSLECVGRHASVVGQRRNSKEGAKEHIALVDEIQSFHAPELTECP